MTSPSLNDLIAPILREAGWRQVISRQISGQEDSWRNDSDRLRGMMIWVSDTQVAGPPSRAHQRLFAASPTFIEDLKTYLKEL